MTSPIKRYDRRQTLKLIGVGGVALLTGCDKTEEEPTTPTDDSTGTTDDTGTPDTTDDTATVTDDTGTLSTDDTGTAPTDDTGTLATDDTGAEACELTSDDIEGPYYREDMPEREDIATIKEDGALIIIGGVVMDPDCVPIPGARVEFWQADVEGDYDLGGEVAHYYGWQETDAEGRYAVTTRMPGRYLNGATYRPSHVHVKVWVDGVERLTTQIYFDGDPYNKTDPWFEESQSIALSKDNVGTFDLVVIT